MIYSGICLINYKSVQFIAEYIGVLLNNLNDLMVTKDLSKWSYEASNVRLFCTFTSIGCSITAKRIMEVPM